MLRICPRQKSHLLLIFLIIFSSALFGLIYRGIFSASLTVPMYDRQFFELPCSLPVLDPHDKSIQKYLRSVTHQVCPNIPSVVFVDEFNVLHVNSSALNFFGLKETSELKCTAEIVYRRHKDKKVGFAEAIHLILPTQLRSDFTRVRCKNGVDTLFDNIVAGISDGSRVGVNPIELENDEQLSVLLFELDSISRSEAIRYLPKTLKYLKEIGAHDFKGQMVIGKNTFPNLFPLLTGIRVGGPNDTDPSGYMDEWPWIWKNFSEKGYVTLFSEDYLSLATFNTYGMKGFRHQPTDHYMRPFWLAHKKTDPFSHETGNTSRFYKINNERIHAPSMCNQNTRLHVDFINYTKRFMLHYKNRRKFMLMLIAELTHHQSTSHLNSADEDIMQFFIWLNDQGFLNRTIVSFFGDHGYRFGSIRDTYVGRIEAKMPLLQIRIPGYIKQRYPGIEVSLKMNTQRLTTHFDHRQTLLDILNTNYKHPSTGSFNGKKRGISLFKNLPYSRSCADAHVPAQYCSCTTAHDAVVKNDSFVKDLANELTNHINNMLGNVSDCKTIRLHQVSSIESLYTSKTQTNDRDRHHFFSAFKPTNKKKVTSKKNVYIIVIETKPGYALFESFCEIDDINGGYNFREVDRINAYGNQSFCVNQAELKPFCYCKAYDN